MNGIAFPSLSPKLKFFFYDAILLKFETYFHMFSIIIEIKIYKKGSICVPPLKVKFFIYSAIMLKFEIQQFHMF